MTNENRKSYLGNKKQKKQCLQLFLDRVCTLVLRARFLHFRSGTLSKIARPKNRAR